MNAILTKNVKYRIRHLCIEQSTQSIDKSETIFFSKDH